MEGDYRMSKNEDTGSPGWGASSFFIQTKEDVARAVAAAAAAATLPRSPRPSVIFSSKDERSGSPLQKLQRQVNKLLNGSSPPPEVKVGNYNPEVLTSQKRQWASFQLQNLDHRHLKEPSKLFESMVVVGLHPNCDIQALERQYIARKSEGSGRLRSALSGQNQSRVEPNLEPQVLFVYPPKKQLPLKYKDLLSFCFPGGLEVHAIERTPSMSELNQVLLGQEHLKQSDMCFVFRLQVADDSTLYGCCMLVEELVQKPGGLLSMISDKRNSCSSLSRFILTTRRCYCILSRLPLFELHFGVLHSIFTEERLERLTEGIALLDSEFPENHGRERSFEENKEETSDSILVDDRITDDTLKEITEFVRPRDSAPGIVAEEQNKVEHQRTEFFHFGDSATGIVSKDQNDVEHQTPDEDIQLLKTRVCNNVVVPVDAETEMFTVTRESSTANTEEYEATEKCVPNALLPLLCYYQYESSESSYSFQDSSCEDRNFRSDIDDTEMEASFSGQDDSSDLIDILEWAKENNHGTLQIICEYYRSPCPARGSVLRFHPLEHLHPLEYHRPGETVLHIAGSTIDLSSCSTSLEYAEAHSSLFAEEEASALSTWAIACMCGSLRLENVLTLFAAALLEKQILVVCSNLGILSAIVLSTIPLIRPYQWQSLIMPVLPNDMLDFLDAPVPYIVGVKNKTSEVQSKLSNVIVIDANKNQVKSSSIPQLPQRKELYSSLSPHYARLVGESFLGKKRPVYKCSNVQVEASKGFISVLRSYVDSLCSNLRSHTITNVQSNHDKVSLLLKESFIDSYPSRDRPFMKHFVDTQLFSVHTDLVLSFFQKQ